MAGRENHNLAAFTPGDIANKKEKKKKRTQKKLESNRKQVIIWLWPSSTSMAEQYSRQSNKLQSCTLLCKEIESCPQKTAWKSPSLPVGFFSYSQIWILKIGTRDSASNWLTLLPEVLPQLKEMAAKQQMHNHPWFSQSSTLRATCGVSMSQASFMLLGFISTGPGFVEKWKGKKKRLHTVGDTAKPGKPLVWMQLHPWVRLYPFASPGWVAWRKHGSAEAEKHLLSAADAVSVLGTPQGTGVPVYAQGMEL